MKDSRSKQLKKMMAHKMRRTETGHTPYRTTSKEIAHDIFHAMVNKKKIPKIPYPENLKRKDKEYRGMSMRRFENKYLKDWK